MKKNVDEILKIINAMNSGVKLIGVTKTFPAGAVLAAYYAGLREFGESKFQEAAPKMAAVNEKVTGVKWHYIGHLQSNKAPKVAPVFDMVQSVDSIELAFKLNETAKKAGKRLDCLLELKVSGEDSKFGISPDRLAKVYEEAVGLEAVRIKGIMTMAPYSENAEEARPYFKKARQVFDSLKAGNPDIEVLSMGMSGDYGVAIEEGSTMVRIGTAIFGRRS